MYHGLEVRVPFLDHLFVEFTGTMPSYFKIKEILHTQQGFSEKKDSLDHCTAYLRKYHSAQVFNRKPELSWGVML